MRNKLVLLCLMLLIAIVSIPNFALAEQLPASSSRQPPAESVQDGAQPRQSAPQNQPTPAFPQSENQQPKASSTRTTVNRAPASQNSKTEPYNPYDMEALKRFDAGSHRAK